MENKKFNWGTLILGIVIGAVVVGIVWAASKPVTTTGAGQGGRLVQGVAVCLGERPVGLGGDTERVTVVLNPGIGDSASISDLPVVLFGNESNFCTYVSSLSNVGCPVNNQNTCSLSPL